jgi:hypothetical protein
MDIVVNHLYAEVFWALQSEIVTNWEFEILNLWSVRIFTIRGSRDLYIKVFSQPYG